MGAQPRPVITYVGEKGVGAVFEPDRDRGAWSVAQRVGQRLLHNAIRCPLDQLRRDGGPAPSPTMPG